MKFDTFDLFTAISELLRNKNMTQEQRIELKYLWLLYHEKLLELLPCENQQKFHDFINNGISELELELLNEKCITEFNIDQKAVAKTPRHNPNWHYDIILDKHLIEKLDKEMIEKGIIGKDLAVNMKHGVPNKQTVLGVILSIVDDIRFKPKFIDKRGRRKTTTRDDKINALLERHHIKNRKMMNSMPEKCRDEAFYNLPTLRDYLNSKKNYFNKKRSA